jgi:hypothetical protein
MDAVKTVSVEIVGEAARASDAGNRDDVLRFEVVLAQHALERHQHSVVAAPLAPAGFLSFVVLEGVCFDPAAVDDT